MSNSGTSGSSGLDVGLVGDDENNPALAALVQDKLVLDALDLVHDADVVG